MDETLDTPVRPPVTGSADGTTAVITGIGACLPPRVVDNDTVIARGGLRTDDTWIRERTGIARRRHADAGTSTGDLAVGAGRAALVSAGDRRPQMLLLATGTPDHPCPATAPTVAHRLGLDGIPAFDLSAVCSGFLYALAMATALIRAGTCATVLVIASDTYTTIVNPLDRETAPIFGDGAGAVLVTAGHAAEPGAVGALDLGSDGSGGDLITIPYGGSRHPRRLPGPDPDGHYFRMRGRAVYAHAVRRMTRSADAALRGAAGRRRPYGPSSATRPTSASWTRSRTGWGSRPPTGSAISGNWATPPPPPSRWCWPTPRSTSASNRAHARC